MNSTSHLAELDLLRRQVADLSRELTERDQTLQEFIRQRDDELQDLRERLDMLRAIVAGTAAETGEDFFSTLVCHLSSVLGVQYAVVGEIHHGSVKKIRTLAVSANGNLVDNFEYPLMNTPCETALGHSFACFERDVRTVFPLFGRLAQLGVEGYCGTPLRAKDGVVIGLLVLMDTKPLRNTDRLQSLMAVFASRAGAELQRWHSETKVLQQQRQLMDAQARVHLGTWDWDLDSGTVHWSDGQFRIFGYEPGCMAVSYDTFMTSLHPLDQARVQSAIDTALKGGTTYDVECRIVRPDRTIRAIYCRGEVCRDVDGRPVSLSNSVLDITDRRHIDEELRLSRERLQQALRASGTGLWNWNTETNQVVYSEEWKRQLGYSGTELPDEFETWVSLLHPDDRERAVAYAMQYRSVADGDYRQEFRLRHKDGTYRWFEARASFVTDADGRRSHLLGSHTDMTDRKRMEETLRESEERYRTLVELSPSGVFVFCEGRTDYVNRTGALLMGAQDPQEILDRPTFEFIHPDYHQEVRDSVKRLLGGGVSVHSAERVYVRMDGTTIAVQVEAGRITWNGKPAILGMFSDITERKQAEQAILEHRHAIRALHDIASVQGQSLNERVEALLHLGRRFFDLPIGMRTFIRGDKLEVGHVSSPGMAFYPGMCVPLSNTYCNETLRQSESVCFEHAGASPEWQWHPAYAVLKLESYLGTAINGVERTYGTLCFASDKPRSKPFTDSERDFIQLMARWLGGEMDRQAALDSLRQSEARYRTLYDETPSMYFTIDATGIVRSVNQFGAQYLGYHVEDLVGKSVSTIFFDTDRARATAEIEALFHQPEGVAQWEFRKVRGDGAVLWVREHARVLQSRDGEPLALVVCEDITERKRTEDALANLNATLERQVDERTDALRRSEERFRQFFDHAPNVTALKDHNGHYLYTNRRFDEVFGLAPGTALRRTDDELFSPEQAAQFQSHDQQVWTSCRGQEFEEITQQDDGPHTSIVVKFPVTDSAGQLSAIGIIATDVTERNRTQEALRESEARWQQFAESVSSAFWIADVAPEEPKVLYVNSAFTFIWGIGREEIYQHWSLWLESIHPDDYMRVKTSHDRFIGGGATAVFHCEYRIVGRDGHIRWISDRRVGMPGWDHRIAGIAEDITHHKQQLALMAQTESIGKIGGWQFDFLTDRLWWSDETYRLHDTTPEVFSPTVETALNFYTPESRPIITEAWLNGVTLGWPWDLELELLTVQGRRIAVRATGQVDVLEGRAVRAYGTFQDITDRKRVEDALRQAHNDLERKVMERTAELRESEERYARATAIGKVGVWELDVLKGHYYGDTNLKMLFGYGPEELSADPLSWLKLVHPSDQPVAMKNWEQVQCGATDECHYELRMIRRDGSVIWTDVRGHGIRDSKGRLTHLIGATVDITERKHAEQTLSESEARFRTLVANIPGAIYRCAVDREWTMSYLSDAIESIVGYPASEFIANRTRSYASVIYPDDRQLVEEVTWASLQEHRPYVIEYRLVHANGTVRWVYEKGQGVFTSNGEVRFLDGAIFDITERKQSEQALRESEERFSKAFRTSPHPIGITEAATGRCIEVNDACLELFGFSREEVIGSTTVLLGIWPNPDDRIRVIERLKSGQPVHNMEFALRTKSGALRYLLASADLAELNGTLCVVTIANDITDRKQADEALRISEERFAKAFQASPHPVVISELDSGRVVDANDAACELFGYGKEEVVGHTTLQIGIWPSTEARDRYLELLKRQGSVRNVEVALRSKSGEIRQCLLSAELIELNGKQCSVTVGDDITESRRLEKALRLTQFSVDQAVEAILWLDPNARMLSVNDAACRMFEYSREELTAMTIHDIDPRFPGGRWVAHWNYLKQQGALTFEAKFWSRTGAVLETDVTVNYLQHEGKEYACMILRDIGERKRAEAELRRSHKFLRQVIDAAPNLIFAKDQDGRFAMANRAVADYYGTTVEDLIGKSDADFNRNREEVNFFRQLDREVIQCAEDRFIPEERITDVEGKTRWLQTVKRPIIDDEGHVRMVLGAATDITERKRMEEMLLQRERDLHAALQERERISQDLHDGILQSLYAVGLGLEACKPIIRQQPERVGAKFLGTLDQAIGQLNQVMGEVRNFIAGLESHVIQGGDFPTALRDMIRTMCSSSSARCTVRIESAAARQLSTEQALHIINIVREGLSNALRHSGARQIVVSLRSLRRCVRLAIQDDGAGFNTSLTQGVGHGLGNMAARAKKVRGQFALDSKPNEGTRIVLDLPKDTTYAHD